MNFNGIPLFSTMKAKLDYISQRQAVLAQNIANADTPGYRAQDVAAPDFKQMVHQSSRSLAMTSTSRSHIVAASTHAGRYEVINRPTTYELNPTGNNVVIEEETMKMAENQAEYQKVLGVYRKTIDMFKTAIGRPSGG